MHALTRPLENFVNKLCSFFYCGFGIKNNHCFDKLIKTCDYLATKLKLGNNTIEEVNKFTYRSSASAVKIELLKEKEIKNIIDLRMTTIKKEIVESYKEAGINYFHIPINPVNVDLNNLKKALFVALISQEEKVLIHCARGIDRTGLVIGLIRVFQDSWDKTMAYDEMISYGFIPDNFPMMNKAFDSLANNLFDEMT